MQSWIRRAKWYVRRHGGPRRGPAAGGVSVFIMVRGHFLGGYFRPNIVTWILQGCLDGSYHVAPTVCQADDYPLRGHTGSAMRSAVARPQLADHGERMKAQSSHFAPHRVLASLRILRPKVDPDPSAQASQLPPLRVFLSTSQQAALLQVKLRRSPIKWAIAIRLDTFQERFDSVTRSTVARVGMSVPPRGDERIDVAP
jgi:hypothetical protein